MCVCGEIRLYKGLIAKLYRSLTAYYFDLMLIHEIDKIDKESRNHHYIKT